ncbi:hypothetical protein AVEN_116681-1 [Araneus ventricosus]|uniref:Uncharacterized protein n=1 Tax=Araneus ventricosus TaxID=182803 RepID=A0A4Y2L6L7_ARAVE|nr:hypothetical protein AVEN_116681-1 [Araneus ventricosus]
MPETGLLTRSMDKQFEKLFVIKAGLEQKMEDGQEEMRSGQERLQQEMLSGQEEIKNQIQAHVESQVDEIKIHDQEVLQEISADKLTDLTTIEKALESRFGDSHLTQFYRTELKTRSQNSGESLQVLAADVERLMSLAYAKCPLDVRESLAVQFFVDAIRDKETQLSTRLMDFTGLKSALAYSMKFESAKTASKIFIHARPIETEDDTWKERDDKFEYLLKALEKLVNSLAAEQNAPLQNPNVTCWKCFKKGMYRGRAK